LAAALLAGSSGAVQADTPMLVGSVGAGDEFVISIAGPDGQRVTHLDPGTYTLVVHDHSSLHNLHLTGPGVDVATDVAGTGDSTFTITLTDGIYRYVCDPHATVMKGAFAVGTARLANPPLVGSVGPGRTISLRAAGKPVAQLAPGPYTLTVHDRSKVDDFRLTGPGVTRRTGVKFRGTVVWKLTVQVGTYVFRSDRHRLSGSFSVG
jgi:antitoxin (DNA-binding transcriptional repressor) of toxin-antitoxin stability system